MLPGRHVASGATPVIECRSERAFVKGGTHGSHGWWRVLHRWRRASRHLLLMLKLHCVGKAGLYRMTNENRHRLRGLGSVPEEVASVVEVTLVIMSVDDGLVALRAR